MAIRRGFGARRKKKVNNVAITMDAWLTDHADVLLSRWKNPTAWSEELLYDSVPDLKIFDDEVSYEKNNQDDQDNGPVRVGTNERVKLVHYPGLDWSNELRNRFHMTKTTPQLKYTYAPAYYYAEAPAEQVTQPSVPTAPQPTLPPDPSSYYYYASYYSNPYDSYPPVDANLAKAAVPPPPPQLCPHAAALEPGEVMDVSDDDVDMEISEDDD